MSETIKKRCLSRLQELKIENTKPYLEKLNEELKYIRLLDREDYILDTVEKIQKNEQQKKANRNGLVFSFLLGATDIDPIENDIPHNKYLSDPPDIDVDISMEAKKIIEQLLINRHGEEHVAHIYTTQNFSPKSSIKDLCRIMSLTTNQNIVQGITDHFDKEVGEGMDLESQVKNFKENIKPTLSKEIKDFLAEKPKYTKNLPREDKNLTVEDLLFKYTKKLSGQVSHTGKHASGIAISSENLYEFAPLKKVKGEVLLALQEGGSAKDVSQYGLLKYDWLGLVNLSKHVQFYDLVKEHYGKDLFEWLVYEHDLDDPETIDIFNNAETLGVFQFSQDLMRQALKKANVKTFEDISIMNAIFRPGPIKNLPILQNYMHNPDQIEIEYDVLKPLIKQTYGIIIYQEQVMLIMQQVGGLTGAEADKGRAILKKLSRNRNPDKDSIEYYEYEKMLNKFLAGATKRGIEAGEAKKLVDDLANHVGYSFNKAHSVSYSKNAYIDAFFKAHYPLIFYKVSCDFESDRQLLAGLIQDARRRGVAVNTFDINRHEFDFSFDIEKKELLLGFKIAKKLREKDLRNIVDYRKENGSFETFDDFLRMCEVVRPNIGTVKPLIELGAFDRIDKRRVHLLRVYDCFLEYLKKLKNKTEKGRWTWDRIYVEVEKLELKAVSELKPEDDDEIMDLKMFKKIKKEFEYMEMYLFNDPIEYATNFFKGKLPFKRVSEYDPFDEGCFCLGYIQKSSIKKTRKNTNYLAIELSDHVKTITVRVWSNLITEALQEQGAIGIFKLNYQTNFNSYTLDQTWNAKLKRFTPGYAIMNA